LIAIRPEEIEIMASPNEASPVEVFARTGIDAARAWLDAVEGLSRSLTKNNPFLTDTGGSCCDIPPPCWMPRHFGNFHSQACRCGTALLRVRVTNCQPTEQEVAVKASSDGELNVKIVPPKATLGPMQSKTFTVAATIGDDVCMGEIYTVVVSVAGCNDHYANWQIRVAEGASGTCLDACVDDCPDYVHHWYDHFYCARPCFSRQRER